MGEYDKNFCDADHGVRILSEEQFDKVIKLLNETVDVVELGVKFALKTIWLVMPASGVAKMIWDGHAYIPLEPLALKYWAVEISCLLYDSDSDQMNRFAVAKVPLLYRPIVDILRPLWQPLDQQVTGSELWYYRDFDGEIRQGVDCTPPRGYKILTDGLADAFPIVTVIVIIGVLNKFGLYTWADNMLRKVMTFMRNRKLNTRIAATKETVERLEDLLSDDVLNKLEEINRRIGLRLIFK